MTNLRLFGTSIVLLVLFGTLGGCSAEGSPTPSAAAGSTPEQKIEKIQNDPNVPDGLKQIQTDTIRRQSGLRP